ncbi:substrate-binding domain-containing protein [Streptomyces pinistramenti]|uniref:substrate-binding domain-containing protein n=1 Tax=Streptomyces pinistramenti TaxID=2884812 RepID=UPI001D0918B7|nr:substrate-binding domain-containing protein [Streptomyces pinistramenti]MCB5906537.1 substrate-binding domain-containing protein [Streptomyces pinistramenti]
MPLTLFSALAVQAAVEDLLPVFTAEQGVAVAPDFDPTTVIERRIAAGARPDVVIGVTSALNALARAGKVAPGSLTPLARTGVGVAVAGGAARPPLATLDDLTTALVSARSVAYSRTGASGIHFARLLQDLGIADEVNARATVIEKGFTARALLDGRADLAVQQLSELAFVPGTDVVGPLPEPARHDTEFTAALATGPTAPAASALLHFLISPRAQASYRRAGLEALPETR